MTISKPLSQAILDRTFAELEIAAAAGLRCPQSPPHGTLHKTAPGALARAGKIKIEIFTHNYRVVTIMDGEHKGKKTAAPPFVGGTGRPYKVIYLDHVLMRRR